MLHERTIVMCGVIAQGIIIQSFLGRCVGEDIWLNISLLRNALAYVKLMFTTLGLHRRAYVSIGLCNTWFPL